jgi:hypothetical protein
MIVTYDEVEYAREEAERFIALVKIVRWVEYSEMLGLDDMKALCDASMSLSKALEVMRVTLGGVQ